MKYFIKSFLYYQQGSKSLIKALAQINAPLLIRFINLHEFLFASLDEVAREMRVYSQRKEFAPRSKFFSLRVDPIQNEGKIKELLPLNYTHSSKYRFCQ